MAEEECGNDGTQLDVDFDDESASSHDATLTEHLDSDVGQQDLTGFSQTQLVADDTAREVELAPPNNSTSTQAGGEGKGAAAASTGVKQSTEPVHTTAPNRCAGGVGNSGKDAGGGRAAHEKHSPVLKLTEMNVFAAVALADQQQVTERADEGRRNGASYGGARAEYYVGKGEGDANAVQRRRPVVQAEGGRGSDEALAGRCADDGRDSDGIVDGEGEEKEQTEVDIRCETQPTQADSPHAPSPLVAAAVAGQGKPAAAETDSRYPGSLDLRLPSSDSRTSCRGQTATSESATSPSTGGGRGEGVVGSSLGLSQLRVASLSAGSPNSGDAGGRRPPSPPRRTGQGSGVFLAGGTSTVGGVASAAGLSPSEGKKSSPSSPPLNANLSRDRMPNTKSEERVPSPHSASATWSTLSNVVGPRTPAADSATAAVVASGRTRDSQDAEETEGFGDKISAGGGDVSPASPGTSVGFLSSAEPSATAVGAFARSLSSPQPLPSGWLDDQLTAAAAKTAPSATARQAGVEDEEGGRERKGKRRLPAGAHATNENTAVNRPVASKPVAAPVTQVRKKPSPGKVVPGPGGWIQTKSSSFKGGDAYAAASGGGGGARANALDCEQDDDNLGTQRGLASQNILAIGVPQERRVRGPHLQQPRVADDPEQQNQWAQSRQEEHEEVETPAGMSPALNTQDINPDDFSQIQKDCSQDRRELECLLDQAIAEGQHGGGTKERGNGKVPLSPSCPFPLDGNGGESGTNAGLGGVAPSVHSDSQSLDGDGGGGGGGSGGRGLGATPGKRKKMRASVAAAAGGEGMPGSGTARRGAASRTPGAYLGGSGSKLSAKKRTMPCPPQNGSTSPTKNVFDLPSDDDGDGTDGARGGHQMCRAKPRSGFPRARKGAINGQGKGEEAQRKKPPLLTAIQPAVGRDRAGSSGNSSSPGGGGGGGNDAEDPGTVGVRESDDDEEDAHVVRTEQELQMERAMAAIRRDLTPVSSAPSRFEGNAHGEEEQEDREGGAEEEEAEVHEEDETEKGDVTATREPHAVAARIKVVATSSRSDAKPIGARIDLVCTSSVPETARSAKVRGSHTPSAPASAGSAGHGSTAPVSGRGGRGRGAAATALDDVASGAVSMPYGVLSPFLEKEGWKCVDGKGLYSWFYLIPGKRGRSGTLGVDFLGSEEDVVEYVRRDKEFLERFGAYRRELVGGSTSGGTSEDGIASRVGKSKNARGRCAGYHGRGGRGENRGGNRGFSAAKCGRGKQTTGGDAGASCATGRKSTRAKGYAKNQAGVIDRDVAGGDIACATEQERQAARDMPESGEWRQQWLVLWPKLKEIGWHWASGNKLTSYLWLKKGVSKNDGTLGVDMFDSEQAVLAHVLGAATPGPADGGAVVAEDREQSTMTGGQPRLQEWALTRNRPKRNRVQPTFPGDKPLPMPIEPADGPSRRAGRKNAGAPPTLAVDGQSAGRRGDDEQPAGGVRRHPIANGTVDSNTGRGGRADVVSQARSRGPGHPPKRLRKKTPAPPLKRRRKSPEEPPPRDVGDGVRGEQWNEMENDEEAGALSEGGMDVATQPQYELALAINMAEVGRGRATASRAAATVAATAHAGGDGLRRGLATTEGDPAAATEAAVRTPEVGRRTATASSTRAACTPSSKRSAGTSTSRLTQGLPEAVAAAAGRDVVHPAPAGNGGSGGGSSCAGLPSLKQPRQAASEPVGIGRSRKRRDSPSGGDTQRASSRHQGPFSGLGVIITGLRGDGPDGTRTDTEKKIKSLGGQVVHIFSNGAIDRGEWGKWLLSEPWRNSVDGGSAWSKHGQRMIAVAAPDGDRTPKFQLAVAAGIPIVHPSYIQACVSMKIELDPAQYLLPLGRSALGDHGVIMPYSPVPGGGRSRDVGGASALPGERPFQDKQILLYVGKSFARSYSENWAFTLRVAGATVTTLEDGGGGGGGGGRKKGKRAAVTGDGGSRCTVEAALDLLRKGQIFCVIGPNRIGGAGDRNDLARATSSRLAAAALNAGTAAGTLEWAIQCMAHRRVLVPNAGTCPWFPLAAAADGGGSVDEAGSKPGKAGGNDSKKGKGRGVRGGAGARGSASGERSGVKPGPFHVHLSGGGKRYVAGDYVFLMKEQGAASGAAAGSGRAVDAAGRPRVVRVLSFERGRDGKVSALVTAMKRDEEGSKVLVGGEEEVVRDDVLGSRVLVMTRREMETTQLYSMQDKDIFCLAHDGT